MTQNFSFPDNITWDELNRAVVGGERVQDSRTPQGVSWKSSTITVRFDEKETAVPVLDFLRAALVCEATAETITPVLNAHGYNTTIASVAAQLTNLRKSMGVARSYTRSPEAAAPGTPEQAIAPTDSNAASMIIIQAIQNSYALSREQADGLPTYTQLIQGLNTFVWEQHGRAHTYARAAGNVTSGLPLFGMTAPTRIEDIAKMEVDLAFQSVLWLFQTATDHRPAHRPLGNGTRKDAYEGLLGMLVEYRHKGMHKENAFIVRLDRVLKGQPIVAPADPKGRVAVDASGALVLS